MERNTPMKWLWSLLLPPLLVSPALAQEPWVIPVMPAPTFSASDPSAASRDVFAEPSSNLLSGNHHHVNFINWMSSPLQNIDPRAVSAIYPIFGSAWVSNVAPIPNGDFQLYGPGITIALGERFAFGLNQGGYADMHFDTHPLARQALFNLDPLGRFRDVESSNGDRSGFLNMGGFFQYTLIDDVQDQFIVTGGLRWAAPCGSTEVFQGHGPLELAPYLTVGKEFFERFHVLISTGWLFPAGPGNDYTENYYANIHFDVQTFHCLYPLIEFNSSFLTKNNSFGLSTRRGFIDFGNFEAQGNLVSMAPGFNLVFVPEHVEFGAVYTTVIASQRHFDANGLLVKLTLRY
jgi:hypothetical protein